MPIQEIQTKSLDEFWEKISPIGPIVNKLHTPVFRGQGDATWHLTPAVFRKDIQDKYLRNENPTVVDQIILFEYMLLRSFLDDIDDIGLTIPNDSEDFRKLMNFDVVSEQYGKDASHWPPKELYRFLGLAQHHGIPTRLLDVTRNPFVAAYFATTHQLRIDTEVAQDSSQRSNELAVWIIDANQLGLLNGELEYITVPGATSNYLAAQKGGFLIYKERSTQDRNTPFAPDNYTEAIEQLLSNHEIAYKVTLPTTFTSNLLFRCEQFGVSAATLFPNFDGAARATLELKLAKKLSDKL